MATCGRIAGWGLCACCGLCSPAIEIVLVTPGHSDSPMSIFLDWVCSFVSFLCSCICLIGFSFWIRNCKAVRYVGNWQPPQTWMDGGVLCPWWVIWMGVPLFLLRCPSSARGPSTPQSSHWRSVCPSGPHMLCCQLGHGKGSPASVAGSLTQRPLLLRAWPWWPWACFLTWPWCHCPLQYPVYTEISPAVSWWTAQLVCGRGDPTKCPWYYQTFLSILALFFKPMTHWQTWASCPLEGARSAFAWSRPRKFVKLVPTEPLADSRAGLFSLNTADAVGR